MTLQMKRVSQIDHAATGAAARHNRKQKHLSLRTVAGRLNFSPAFLSDLERGRRNWNAELLKRFREALTRKFKP